MRKCWNYNAAARPSFESIVLDLYRAKIRHEMKEDDDHEKCIVNIVRESSSRQSFGSDCSTGTLERTLPTEYSVMKTNTQKTVARLDIKYELEFRRSDLKKGSEQAQSELTRTCRMKKGTRSHSWKNTYGTVPKVYQSSASSLGLSKMSVEGSNKDHELFNSPRSGRIRPVSCKDVRRDCSHFEVDEGWRCDSSSLKSAQSENEYMNMEDGDKKCSTPFKIPEPRAFQDLHGEEGYYGLGSSRRHSAASQGYIDMGNDKESADPDRSKMKRMAQSTGNVLLIDSAMDRHKRRKSRLICCGPENDYGNMNKRYSTSVPYPVPGSTVFHDMYQGKQFGSGTTDGESSDNQSEYMDMTTGSDMQPNRKHKRRSYRR